jgi:putative ABC transport system permease protein
VTSLLLGWRLAASPASRLRSVLTLLTMVAGSVVLLGVAAVARAEMGASASAYSRQDLGRLVLVVVVTIAVPLAVLVATVSRLSASLRDRRLANLRLMGLTPGQTRAVAASESAAVAVLGTLLGWGLFWLVRPLLADRVIAGRTWPDLLFRPTLLDQLLVLVCLPGLAALLGVLPQRGTADTALARARRADRRPPSPWRVVPLVCGIAVCLGVVANGQQQDIPSSLVTALFAGVGLTGLGLVLVVPVFVRLLAALLLTATRGPAARIASRRLEAQPAAVTRVVAALLIGLFVVTGARFVLVAFESTPQYVAAERNIKQGERIAVYSDIAPGQVVRRVLALDGVEDALAVPRVTSTCTGQGSCWSALVVTCAELRRITPDLPGCHDGVPMWLGQDTPDFIRDIDPELARRDTLVWKAGSADTKETEVLTTPVAMETYETADARWHPDLLGPIQADAILPPSLVGTLPPETMYEVLVTGPPGRSLMDTLDRSNALGSAYGYTTSAGYEDYDFVAGLRTLVWTVAGLVLAIGLLAFAVAAIDRAVERRREVVALQLVGVPRRVLRRAQWVEALVPVVVGSVLAVALGALAGATYLSIDEGLLMPWSQTVRLALAAALGGTVVAGLTVVASAPRIRPEQIRRE